MRELTNQQNDREPEKSIRNLSLSKHPEIIQMQFPFQIRSFDSLRMKVRT